MIVTDDIAHRQWGIAAANSIRRSTSSQRVGEKSSAASTPIRTCPVEAVTLVRPA